MPDDHSDVVPLLPIPNRTVKRLLQRGGVFISAFLLEDADENEKSSFSLTAALKLCHNSRLR